MSCGSLEYLEGGTLKSVSVLNSQIVNSAVANSDLESCSIKSLASIDADSAHKIADAISELSPEQLAALAKALFSAIGASTAEPVKSNDSALPTQMFGARNSSLGGPNVWMTIGGYVVPGYLPEGGAE